MSKSEELLGVKYTELNPQQKKIYQNILKKESRRRNPESIKTNNKKYYEKQKQIVTKLKHQLAEKEKEIEKYNGVLETYKKKPINIYQVEIRNLQVDKAELKLEIEKLKTELNNLRLEICEKIREKFGLKQVEQVFNDVGSSPKEIKFTYEAFTRILDQIEGEK